MTGLHQQLLQRSNVLNLCKLFLIENITKDETVQVLLNAIKNLAATPIHPPSSSHSKNL